MKTMTCKQLGGACDEKFTAATFEEMAELSKAHGMEMFKQGDEAHMKAMEEMRKMMQDGKVQEWLDEKRKEFDALSEE